MPEGPKKSEELEIELDSVATGASGPGLPVRPIRITPGREFSALADRARTPAVLPPTDVLLGKTIGGRYQLAKLIAKGGMGRVYAAIQQPLGRKVAIKVLTQRLDSGADPQFVRRFFLEAAVCARLQHPNIVTVHDYGEDVDGQLYMVMELLDGEPLNAVVKRDGALDPERSLMVALQVGRALREAHARGVIHRDLKPGNIMLLRGKDIEAGEAVKVLDFGLVKIFQAEGEPIPEDLAELDLTRAGILLGSPRYMSPEQVKNEPLDPRTDIYSLGVILYHMLAGRPPFNGKTSIDIMHAHVHDAPASISGMPLEIESVVFKALAKSPAARYATIDEFIDGIKSALRAASSLTTAEISSAVIRASSVAPAQALAEPVVAVSPAPSSGPDDHTHAHPLHDPGPRLAKKHAVWIAVILLAAAMGVLMARKVFEETPPRTPAPASSAPRTKVLPSEVAPSEAPAAPSETSAPSATDDAARSVETSEGEPTGMAPEKGGRDKTKKASKPEKNPTKREEPPDIRMSR